jgi:hypothetical protein
VEPRASPAATRGPKPYPKTISKQPYDHIQNAKQVTAQKTQNT